MLWGHILSVAPRDILDGKEKPAFISTPATTVLARLLPMRPCAAPRGVARSMTSRRRSPCACSRRSPAHPVRCAPPRRRIHGDYGRTLADLPWAQYRVCLQLRVRKWFCPAIAAAAAVSSPNGCPPSRPLGAAHAAARSAPDRPRQGAWGNAGVQLDHAWDVVMSRNTLLRGLRKQPVRSPRPGVRGG